MSELTDKQVNAQKESLKNIYFRGSSKHLQAHKKVCDENESRNKEKNIICTLKYVWWKEGVYKARLEGYYDSMIVDTMKVLCICLVNG